MELRSGLMYIEVVVQIQLLMHINIYVNEFSDFQYYTITILIRTYKRRICIYDQTGAGSKTQIEFIQISIVFFFIHFLL